MNDQIKVMIPEEDLKKRIREMGEEISKDLNGEPVLLICILKGSIFFTCELSRAITSPVTFDFMSVSSYGDATKSSGIVRILKDTDELLVGKNVLVVEDIIDTGRTLKYLLNILEARQPKTLRLCTLLDKPSRRVTEVKVDYIGFTIEDRYVVGYGLDKAQQYRNLPYIGEVERD